MNRAIYAQSEPLNMILDDVDKTLRVESSSDNQLFVTMTDISVNSIMEYSTNATVQLVGEELSIPLSLAKADKFFYIFEELDFRSLPDEYVVYTFYSTQTSEIDLSVGWKELF